MVRAYHQYSSNWAEFRLKICKNSRCYDVMFCACIRKYHMHCTSKNCISSVGFDYKFKREPSCMSNEGKTRFTFARKTKESEAIMVLIQWSDTFFIIANQFFIHSQQASQWNMENMQYLVLTSLNSIHPSIFSSYIWN